MPNPSRRKRGSSFALRASLKPFGIARSKEARIPDYNTRAELILPEERRAIADRPSTVRRSSS